MRSERERKDDSIKRNANIAAIIGVFIAALTLLFGSGIILPLFSDQSDTPSINTDGNSNSGNIGDGIISDDQSSEGESEQPEPDADNNISSEDKPAEEVNGETNDNQLSVPPTEEGISIPSIDNTDNQIAASGAIISSNNSRIHIETAILADDGFYYQAPNDNWFINMEKLVLTGSFTYSNELTEDEKKNWWHGGHLLNGDGVRCYEEETSFWSDYDALQFAVDLPENIEPGIYTCVLYQLIYDQQIPASIQFEIY